MGGGAATPPPLTRLLEGNTVAKTSQEIQALEARPDTIKGTFELDGRNVTFAVAHDDYCVTTRGVERHARACTMVEAMQAVLEAEHVAGFAKREA